MPTKLNVANIPAWFCALVILCSLPVSNSSRGERSLAYRQCMYWCNLENCSKSHATQFKAFQPWYMSILLWECEDECKYSCMWYVIQKLEKRGHPVPQFHGKWPFTRLFGIQEPASAVFSVLNGVSHFLMWRRLKKDVPDIKGFNIWNMQAILSINAWIWSSIFHTRDTPITEKLDYYGAFSLVLYSFYSLLVKISSNSLPPLAIAVPFLVFFTYHISYLTFVKFDYGYNMTSNVIVGLMNSFGWLLWSYKNRHKPYVWKCVVSILSVNILLLLELGDFPPWQFFVDAHALWHLGTIPVPFLWYSFVIEECLYERERQRKQV